MAAFWGASYLFIKVALEDVFSPPMIVFVRTALAALVLAPLAWRTGRVGALRGAGGVIVLLAVIQVVAPFMLISYGEDHISSSLAGILVSTAPIYAFLLAVVITPEERAKRIGAIGVAIGHRRRGPAAGRRRRRRHGRPGGRRDGGAGQPRATRPGRS